MTWTVKDPGPRELLRMWGPGDVVVTVEETSPSQVCIQTGDYEGIGIIPLDVIEQIPGLLAVAFQHRHRELIGAVNEARDDLGIMPANSNLAEGKLVRLSAAVDRREAFANPHTDAKDHPYETSFIVPFSPFGAFHISRTLQPQLPEFLYDLSESDGIDTTVPDGARYVEQKTADVRVDEPDPLRNGEPYGELGMVRQTDFDWHDQTGAPNDPQPGNLQGKREIMRRELFTDNELLSFAADTGTWTLAGGRYAAAPAVENNEVVSVFYLDEMQPSYMEILVHRHL